MIAGNVGRAIASRTRSSVTPLNQAARLQVKTRDVGASILVTESTRAALGGPNGFVLRPVGAVPLKGISAPVEVFAVEARPRSLGFGARPRRRRARIHSSLNSAS